MVWVFWEYVTLEFSEWRDGLPKRDRAILDEKMRMIERNGQSATCLKGPLGSFRHLYKIKARGPTFEMRPLLCKGPVDMDAEFTMLKPMIEKDFEDVPATAKGEAERRRLELKADKNKRVRYKVPQP